MTAKHPTPEEATAAFETMNEISGGVWSLHIYSPVGLVIAVAERDEGAQLDLAAASDVIGAIQAGTQVGCALCRSVWFGVGTLPSRIAIMRPTQEAIAAAFDDGRIKECAGIIGYAICDKCIGPDLDKRVLAMLRTHGGLPDAEFVTLSDPGHA